ncbi:MAG: hypothetical protein PHE50_09285 [Dehalococcoidales bacterium]|nr:hypothetical protein [Dehalococcoidales bacterium]
MLRLLVFRNGYQGWFHYKDRKIAVISGEGVSNQYAFTGGHHIDTPSL